MKLPADPLEMSLTEAFFALEAGAVSSRELTAAALDRAHAVQPTLNAFIRFNDDQALAAAQAVDARRARGEALGPLAGVPLAYKDMFYRQGQVCTCGSRLREHWRAPVTATVLERLDAAGAVDLGTLHMTEFAYGPTGQNGWRGDAHNPWDPTCISGGSSSGPAIAVATRSAYGALGSDTAGSVRLPAALCGITGMKVTHGRVSRFGCMPLSGSLDTVGPLTRGVADNALLLSLIAGTDTRDPATLPFQQALPDDYCAAAAPPTLDAPLHGLRIGLPRGYFDRHLDPHVQARLDEAARLLEDAGARCVEVPMPAELDAINAAGVLLNWGDVISLHGPHLRDQAALFSAQTRGRIEVALAASAQDYLDAQRYRGQAVQHFAKHVFSACDVLMAPVLSMATPRLDQVDVNGGPEMISILDEITRLTRPANVLGLPALALPCGFMPSGPPVGMQLMGRPFAEALLYRIGAAYQQRTAWHTFTPPLPY